MEESSSPAISSSPLMAEESVTPHHLLLPLSPSDPPTSSTTNTSSTSSADDQLNGYGYEHHPHHSDDFFKNLPPGYKFCPEDDELIVFYLRRKVDELPLPPNRIIDVNIYQSSPEDLAAKYQKCGEKEWYFFTPRDRKYPNGNRPRRAAGDGYWKATGADKKIYRRGKVVGYRKTLVFYRGKAQQGSKTNWIMHEFRVEDVPPRERKGLADMTLDRYILSRIYKKADPGRGKLRQEDHARAAAVHKNGDDDQAVAAAEEAQSESRTVQAPYEDTHRNNQESTATFIQSGSGDNGTCLPQVPFNLPEMSMNMNMNMPLPRFNEGVLMYNAGMDGVNNGGFSYSGAGLVPAQTYYGARGFGFPLKSHYANHDWEDLVYQPQQPTDFYNYTHSDSFVP